MKLRHVLLTLCCCLFAGAYAAYPGQDAATLLQRLETRYRGLENYYAEGTFEITAEVMGFSQVVTAPFVIAGKVPGKSRMEINHETFGVLLVSDGEATWSYFATFGQYTKQTSVPVGSGVSDTPDGTAQGPVPSSGNFLTYYKSFDPAELTARNVGTEAIDGTQIVIASDVVSTEGGGVECTVVELTHTQADSLGQTQGPDTLWVDPQSDLVLRSVHNMMGEVQGMPMKTRLVLGYGVLRLEQPPPDSLFVFTPPEGARLVGELSLGPAASDLTGQVATDFKLTALGGKTFQLADLKGKVVLIDFWATWCPPCRKELPVVEKLHREYSNKGLVVLAITSETKSVAASFIEEHGYTFPVLIDAGQAVFDEYDVKSIPVAIIVDKQGRITAHFTGLRDEAELRSALQAAGIQ